jgi:Ca2+-binding EF-hand superfamily protein
MDNLARNLQIDTVTEDDSLLFFERYDVNRNGKVTFAEFCKAVTPLAKEYAQLITGRPDFYSRKESIHVSEYFNLETRAEVRALFRTLLHTHRANECLRARIARRPHFSLHAAFAYLDRTQTGIVTTNDVRDMLADHGFFATEKEMQLLMNKFDKDRDLKISAGEFLEEMTPKLPL